MFNEELKIKMIMSYFQLESKQCKKSEFKWNKEWQEGVQIGESNGYYFALIDMLNDEFYDTGASKEYKFNNWLLALVEAAYDFKSRQEGDK